MPEHEVGALIGREEIDAGQLDESLHVLHEEGYVRFFWVSEGIKYVHLDPLALDEYCAATQPHFEAATKAVLAHIANHRDEIIVTVPRPEGVASIAFQGILKRWKRRRMFTVMKSFGPQ